MKAFGPLGAGAPAASANRDPLAVLCYATAQRGEGNQAAAVTWEGPQACGQDELFPF